MRPEFLNLRTEDLKYVHTDWSWCRLVMMWMAETELSNVILVRYVHIRWLPWPDFVWDEAFTFIDERPKETVGGDK